VADNIITQKLGPLPLVVWVIGGSGAVLLFVMLTHKGNNGAQANATNQVSALAPTEAEAFGTLEQQQQDVSNALTTLGQNQAALGGSLGTLSGTIDTNQNWNAAQFANILGGLSQVEQGQTDEQQQAAGFQQWNAAQLANLLGGQATIQQGQAAANQQAANYYTTLLQNLSNWFNNLSATVANGDAGLSQQVAASQNAINTNNNNNTAYLANLDQAGINATWSQYGNLLWNLQHPTH
jgi:hypothetical protein